MCSALEIVSLFYSTGSDEEMYLGDHIAAVQKLHGFLQGY